VAGNNNVGAPQEEWHRARLIPTVGIRGQEEQEKRATSSLLAVMHAVPEFSHALIGPLGAPKAQPDTYAEVRFKQPDGKIAIPDGAIVVARGKRRWSCLVEVKTGSAELQPEQVSRYLDLARDHNFDAVVTISNAITSTPTESPISVDRRKLRRVALYHLSWWRVITEAIVQHRFRGVSDPDQAWILGELIAYLDAEASGASGFQDMGAEWVRVRDAARAGTLRANDKEVRAVVGRWEQFIEYLALGLSQDLGADVAVARPRNQAPEQRADALVRELADAGRLQGGLKVPGTVAPLQIVADLGRRQVRTAVTLDAPREMRPTARVNWLLRQLREAPADLAVETGFEGARETSAAALAEAREQPDALLSQVDRKRAPRAFTLTMTRPMGLKRGKGRGSLIGDTRQQTFDFYRAIVQGLKPWQTPAPKLREPEPEKLPLTPQAEPPPFVAADEREVGDAVEPADLPHGS
jgi:hypothetical protein